MTNDYGDYYGLTDEGAKWFEQLENRTTAWEGPTLFGCRVCGAAVAFEALGSDTLGRHVGWHNQHMRDEFDSTLVKASEDPAFRAAYYGEDDE
jgi:hypothetical protein